MSPRLPLFFAAPARREIVRARAWWIANREKAPSAFDEDLEQAVDLIARQTSVGASATNVRLRGVRRLLLGRVHYYLYYRVSSEPARVEVLSIRHTSRGSNPPL